MFLDNRCPDICVRKDGMITISAKLADMLGLQDGHAINVKKENGETYLFLVVPPQYRTIKGVCKSVGKSRTLRTYWKELADILLSDLQLRKARYMIGEPIIIEEQKLVPIITKFTL